MPQEPRRKLAPWTAEEGESSFACGPPTVSLSRSLISMTSRTAISTSERRKRGALRLPLAACRHYSGKNRSPSHAAELGNQSRLDESSPCLRTARCIATEETQGLAASAPVKVASGPFVNL